MADFTVTTTADTIDPNDGALSLREAVNLANATDTADTIEFAPAFEGRTLMLSGGELSVSEDLHIDGEDVTLDAAFASRLLNIMAGGPNVTLDNLTLAHGGIAREGNYYVHGGGVYVGYGSSLAMTGCTIRDCDVSSYGGIGGGIYAAGGNRLTLTNCSIIGNESSATDAVGKGGGIATGENVRLTIRDSEISDNVGWYGGAGIFMVTGSRLVMENSDVSGNFGGGRPGAKGGESYSGGLGIYGVTATISNSTISDNTSDFRAAGIAANDSHVTLVDSTVANNIAYGGYDGGGGIYVGYGALLVHGSTITGNRVYEGSGGGIFALECQLEIANSIVAGNSASGFGASGPDVYGTITLSNGHNVFGSDIGANAAGDRENIAASVIFAAIDPATGGGQLSPSGIVPLLNNSANPALSGGDLLAASTFGQLGGTARPLPAGSLPDIGSIEINQPLSTAATANNDVRTGTSAANSLSGLGGNDYLRGLGGKDTLSGGASSDLLDGGTGNDKLNGGSGTDLVFYGGSTAVVVDLSVANDTAKRGSEVDTLTSIEGAVGSTKADTFKGDANANWFQGGLGKDTFSGGSSRDLYDFNAVAESGVGGTNRDVITEFDHLVDDIDLMGIDADTTIARDQAFHWVGNAVFTGAPGELGFFASGGNTIIRGSNDADVADEFQIQLTGIKMLTVDDFYF